MAHKYQSDGSFKSCCSHKQGVFQLTIDPGYQSGATRASELVVRTPVEQLAWYWWWQFHRERYVRTTGLLKGQMESATEGPQGPRRDEAARVLATLLEHEDWRLRAAATMALGRLSRSTDPVPAALERRLGDSKVDVRLAAALALGASELEAAGPILARRVGANNVDRLEQAYATVALGFLPGQTPRLVEIGRSTREIPLQFATLLGLKAARDASGLELAMGFASQAANPIMLRAVAVSALADLDREGKSLALLDQLCRGTEPELSCAALMALAHLRHPRASGVLRALANASLKPLPRGYWLLALGLNGGEDARPLLRRAFAEERKQQPWCALALGLSGDREAAPALLAQARKTHGGQLECGALALALGLLASPELAGLLPDWTSRAIPEVKGMLAEAAGLLGDRTQLSWLAGRIAKDPDYEVQRAAVISACLLDGVQQAAGWVAEGRASKDVERQRAAIRLTGVIPDAELAVPPLLALLDLRAKVDDRSRVQAALALGDLLDRARWRVDEPRTGPLVRLGLGLHFPALYRNDLLEPLLAQQ